VEQLEGDGLAGEQIARVVDVAHPAGRDAAIEGEARVDHLTGVHPGRVWRKLRSPPTPMGVERFGG
jgi:hypothetical protein